MLTITLGVPPKSCPGRFPALRARCVMADSRVPCAPAALAALVVQAGEVMEGWEGQPAHKPLQGRTRNVPLADQSLSSISTRTLAGIASVSSIFKGRQYTLK